MKKIGLGLFILMFFSCDSDSSELINSNQSSKIDSLNLSVELDSIHSIQLDKIDSISEGVTLLRKKIITDKIVKNKPKEVKSESNSKELNDMVFGFGSSSVDGFAMGNGVGDSGSGNGFGMGEGVGSGVGDSGDPELTNLNRKIINYGEIKVSPQEEGKVSLYIWVNEGGDVVRVKFDPTNSNTSSDYLISLAKKWAFTMKYEKVANSQVQWVGYEIFNFKLQ